MAGWHHWRDGRESEWTPGVGDGQGGLACCDSWDRKESDTTELLNWTELNVVGILQSLEGLARAKKWGEGEFMLSAGLSWRNTSLLPLDWHWLFSLQCALPATHLVLQILRPLDWESNYNTCLPGSPVCRWQIVGVLNIQYHVSQFPKINYPSTYLNVCFYMIFILFLSHILTKTDFGIKSYSRRIFLFNRLFFKVVLSSYQNWVGGAEISHITPAPQACTGSHIINIPYHTKAVHLLQLINQHCHVITLCLHSTLGSFSRLCILRFQTNS